MNLNMWKAIGISSLLFVSAPVFAHDTNARGAIDFGDIEVPAFNAGAIPLSFDVIDTLDQKVLTPNELNIENTKILHVMIFDPALKEYRHEHPVFVAGKWTLTTHLTTNGTYWIWAQGQVKSDGGELTAPARFTVTGGTPESAAPTDLPDLRTGADGNSRVTVGPGVLKAGQMAMLNLSFSREDGSAPHITNYLGASAHIVIVSIDGDSLIHTHPVGSGNSVMIHTQFPDAGDYRVWIQFKDGGVLHTVALSVQVSK